MYRRDSGSDLNIIIDQMFAIFPSFERERDRETKTCLLELY